MTDLKKLTEKNGRFQVQKTGVIGAFWGVFGALNLPLLSVKTSSHDTRLSNSWGELDPFGSDFLLIFIATHIGQSSL